MMNWKTLAALGVVGAAVALPIIKKKLANKADFGFGSAGPDSNLSTTGGMNMPASDTWAQSQNPS
jgi:hypothetical protein